MNYIYVSVNGSVNAKGSRYDPVSSLCKALELSRNLSGETEIVIESGRYFFTETAEMNDRDNNTTVRAEGNVVFDGGVILDNSKILDFRDGIKVIDLSYLGIDLHEPGNRGFRRAYVNAPNEFFINSVAQNIARYPKKGINHYGENDIIEPGSHVTKEDYECKSGKVRINDDRIERWKDARHAYLAGYPCCSWADEFVKIAEIDTKNRTVTTEQPHLFTYKFTRHSGYYIVNLLEELTDEGEYYIDIDDKKLYFIPPKGTDLSSALLQLSVLDRPMLTIENSKGVTIQDIVFENSRNTAVYIEGGDGVTVSGCTFRNLGILAIQIGMGATPLEHGLNNCHGKHSPKAKPFLPISRQMGSWHEYIYEFAAWDNNGGKNHTIENCKIHDTGAGGILLSGGNRKKLIPANNRVHNCEFYSVNRLDKTYKAAVNMMGVGNTVSHCYMHDLPGMAIYIHGNDHLIEYNDICRVVLEVSDSGAIYMGRDMSEVGCVFRNNFFHEITNSVKTDLGACAIYFDDWDIFNTVYDNFFYKIDGGGFCIIHHTCGGLLSFHNNFIVDCIPGVNCDNKSNSYIRMHRDPLAMIRVHTTDENDMRGVDVTSEIYRKKYPYLYDVYENDARPEWMYYNNLFVNGKYDAFVNAENGDFTQADWFGKPSERDEFDWQRRTDVVMGYKDDFVPPHRVDFKSIGLIKENKQ